MLKNFTTKWKKVFAILCLTFLFFSFCKPANVENKDKNLFPYRNQKITFLVTIPQAGSAKAIADWFTQETKAVVQITEVGYDETFKKTIDDINSTNPKYDILTIWYPELGVLVKKDAVIDLTSWIEKNQNTIKPNDFIPSIYNAYTLQRKKKMGTSI